MHTESRRDFTLQKRHYIGNTAIQSQISMRTYINLHLTPVTLYRLLCKGYSGVQGAGHDA